MAHDDDDTEALDRAAILSRRQRFIALALSGLATACGDDASTTTNASLGMSSTTETSTSPDEGDTTAVSTGQPCLVPMSDTSSTDTTGAAESTTSTGTDTGESTGTGDTSGSTTSDGDSGSGSSSGGPLPCLAPKP